MKKKCSFITRIPTDTEFSIWTVFFNFVLAHASLPDIISL